ncbi:MULTISPECIES: TetR/AcrR family transcriptional regulator [Comamonas]|uniref:TetR/AcrR family transcriptional regulator n=1 Tax=Comamonas TaxID=283 RepID=UPI0015FD4C94|nr:MULTISPECIES: TetR/AcrR family transcriptional regulator [Comamonas]UUC93403.1 TetR/AcrR family transcriptional regulator [Comamonas sp. C11]WEE77398.1 TetR/AcrR family transcriptional regulator [Comamonas testosteroni]
MPATSRKTEKKPAAPVAPRGRQRLPTAGSDEKRERILKAAEALFDRYGYANTTIEQIVQALGVTKPFVYYYFRNKQEIFETLCWAPTEACFTVLDFAADDPRPAHEKAIDGLQRLIAATIAHYPAGFFPYREPQAFSPAYLKASRNVAQQFYKQFCALLDEGRASGHFDFRDTRITAQAACSLPGFLYNWYQPGGKLGPAEMVVELTDLASRVLGLRTAAAPARKRATRAAPAPAPQNPSPPRRRKSASSTSPSAS